MIKLIWISLVIGCGWADRNLKAGPTPVIGISTGAIVNGGLIAAKAPWWLRLGTIAGVGYWGRIDKKWEGWHIEVVGGAMLSEIGSLFVCKGPCHD